MNNIRQKMRKKGNNTHQEVFIIIFSNTVIKPDTMVIKPMHTSVTREAMFAFFVAVAAAKSAVLQEFHVGKDRIEMTDVGLVKVNDFVGGVWEGRKQGKCQGDDACGCMDSDEGERLVLGCEAEVLGDDLGQDDWGYEYLSPCYALGQAVCSVFRDRVVLRGLGICL